MNAPCIVESTTEVLAVAFIAAAADGSIMAHWQSDRLEFKPKLLLYLVCVIFLYHNFLIYEMGENYCL